MKKGRHSKYPEDFKEEVREMRADGLTIRGIATYLGVSPSTVNYILNPERTEASVKIWRDKNIKKQTEYMRAYSKKYYAAKVAKEAARIQELRNHLPDSIKRIFTPK